MIQRHFRIVNNTTDFYQHCISSFLDKLLYYTNQNSVFDKNDVKQKMLLISTIVKMTATREDNYFVIPSTIP